MYIHCLGMPLSNRKTDKMGLSNNYANVTGRYACLCGYVDTTVNVGLQLRKTIPKLESRGNITLSLPSGLAELTELGNELWAGAVPRAACVTVSRALCASVRARRGGGGGMGGGRGGVEEEGWVEGEEGWRVEEEEEGVELEGGGGEEGWRGGGEKG